MTDRRPKYVAICPDCEASKDLHYPPPVSGPWWPQCDDCWQSMNVFKRGVGETAQTARLDKQEG